MNENLTIHEANAKINGEQKTTYVDGDAWSGLTKREYFAGLAMQGLIASKDWQIEPINDNTAIVTSVIAVEFADELLKQLEKTK